MNSFCENYIEVLQTESKKCLKEFVRACDENNLKYFLFFGSLLGAVRHKGFIPWDDDIDITMPRKDYEQFISLYGSHFTDDYFLDSYNCAKYLNYQPNCRIDFKHLLIRKDKENGAHYYNAFISIFPIDGVPNNRLLRTTHIFLLKILYGLLRLARSARNGTDKLEKRSINDKFFIALSKVFPIGRLISPQVIAKNYNILRSKYDYVSTSKSIVYWNHMLLDSKLMIEEEEAIFDGLNCKIPSGWDELLKLLYGDYMILPPEKDRTPHHGYELIQE